MRPARGRLALVYGGTRQFAHGAGRNAREQIDAVSITLDTHNRAHRKLRA